MKALFGIQNIVPDPSNDIYGLLFLELNETTLHGLCLGKRQHIMAPVQTRLSSVMCVLSELLPLLTQ